MISKTLHIEEMGIYVQRTWLSKLSWKMQTVINQGLRAPDTHFCKNVKIMCRWLRSIVLQNADKDHTFMCSKNELPTVEEMEHELNYCSVHFATHFLYALEIVAYKHSEETIRNLAYRYYKGIISELWHLHVEKEEELDIRLSDVDRQPAIKECPKDTRKDKYINLG
jgi:hypothetical protein